MVKNKFFTSQLSVSCELIILIDKYLNKQIGEKYLKNCIYKIIISNEEIILDNGEIKSIIRQRLGKKRIRIFTIILRELGVIKNE